VGQLLVAQACVDLGFLDQAERIARQALSKASGPAALSLEFCLANVLLKESKTEEALSRLEKTATATSPYRAPALLQLARLDLEGKRFAECLQKCEDLWNERALADTQSVLQVWGAALEAMGDFARAAQCFAGKAPL
jgi:tetratricopeptide (TPR) repeat protein